MKSIIRFLILISLLGIIVSTILLLNFTAPNPTGRRYSSQTPLNTGDPIDIGKDAERILSLDLKQPNNNDLEQGQCLCNSTANLTPSTNQCRVCVVSIESNARYRKPDFMTSKYMADSKNWPHLPLTYSYLYSQVQDFVVGARMLNIPFWLYVPVNKVVDSRIVAMIESTGGGVVPYFAVPGYVNPVDEAAQKGLVVASGVLGFTIIGMLASRRFKNRPRVVLSPTPKPPRSPKPSDDPVSKAVRKTDNAEDFIQRSKEKRRQDIAIEDSRDDLL